MTIKISTSKCYWTPSFMFPEIRKQTDPTFVRVWGGWRSESSGLRQSDQMPDPLSDRWPVTWPTEGREGREGRAGSGERGCEEWEWRQGADDVWQFPAGRLPAGSVPAGVAAGCQDGRSAPSPLAPPISGPPVTPPRPALSRPRPVPPRGPSRPGPSPGRVAVGAGHSDRRRPPAAGVANTQSDADVSHDPARRRADGTWTRLCADRHRTNPRCIFCSLFEPATAAAAARMASLWCRPAAGFLLCWCCSRAGPDVPRQESASSNCRRCCSVFHCSRDQPAWCVHQSLCT